MASMKDKQVFCLILMTCFILFSTTHGWAQGQLKFKRDAAKSNAQRESGVNVPQMMTPEDVSRYVAGLNDEQARRVLVERLDRDVHASSKNQAKVGERRPALVTLFYGALETLDSLSARFTALFKAADVEGGLTHDQWAKLVGGTGGERLAWMLFLLVAILLTGLSAERAFLSVSRRMGSRMFSVSSPGKLQSVGAALYRLIIKATGIFVYMAVTFLLYFAIFGRGATSVIISSSLIMSYYLRLIVLAARFITSPDDPLVRPLPLSDADAQFLFRWISLISASTIPSTTLSFSLKQAGAGRELVLLTYSMAGPIMSLLLILMIFGSRKRVAHAICSPAEVADMGSFSLAARCAGLWHTLAILYVVVIGSYWWARVLSHADVTILNLVFSLFLIPCCIGIDWWIQRALTLASGGSREVIDLNPTRPEVPLQRTTEEDGSAVHPDSPEKRTDFRLYLPLVRKVLRALLVLLLLFTIMKLWGIGLDTGWLLARSGTGILVAVVLGLVLWELAKARIDQSLREEMPFQGGDLEEGGKGGSRKATLLLLFRKFILVVLLVIVSFGVLSSLGVDIGPLLAAAGVVGLAIGFGAQTLVKDIISGIFFLMDDAIRVGDYVEAGSAKGTVEHISLRSLRLRHPRGQIFTIPFGDLKQVTNFTRDYIIEKLDIRVRFDTDPEIIRKIIKKINKAMSQDEEYSRVLLSDIKSSGVRTMDDSAMIMRVKFKCIPGEQFVVRRQVYQRLREAFKEQGIEFAHRNVTVYLPPQPTSGSSAVTPNTLEAAGAAAAAIVQADEEKALKQAEAKKKPL